MFGKFFASTFTGSLFGAGPTVFAVWGYVIANAVASTIELNPAVLAAVLGTDEAAILDALAKLTAPDPKSRNPTAEGRRLIHEHGFQYHVVSHERYRLIRNEDDRRAYNRAAQARSRAKRRSQAVSTGVNRTVNELSALSAQAEAEAEAEAEPYVPPYPPRGDGESQGTPEQLHPPDLRSWPGATNRRGHLRHAFCGRVCLPAVLHDELKRAFNLSEDQIRADYRRVDDAWAPDKHPEAVPPNPFEFWRERFMELYPPAAPKSRRELAADAAVAACDHRLIADLPPERL